MVAQTEQDPKYVSGVKGVRWSWGLMKWVVTISQDGAQFKVGDFALELLDMAIEARREAEIGGPKDLLILREKYKALRHQARKGEHDQSRYEVVMLVTDDEIETVLAYEIVEGDRIVIKGNRPMLVVRVEPSGGSRNFIRMTLSGSGGENDWTFRTYHRNDLLVLEGGVT